LTTVTICPLNFHISDVCFYVIFSRLHLNLRPKLQRMYRLLFFCICIWISTPSCVDIAKIQKPKTSAIPVLRIANDSTGKTLQIHKLVISVQVTGNIATTTFDITFYNSLDKQLEGEFDFPLADGQSISRYALEVGDKLREGVVVEKAKARVAFENTERRKIDPGLVEKTKGNNFRTRIYPIPARGYKRVVIGIEQALQLTDGALVYELPLYTDYKLGQFSIDAAVALPSAKPLLVASSFKGANFSGKEPGWQASFQQSQFQPADLFAFTIPVDKETPLVYTETTGGKQYFYAYLPGNDSTQSKPLPKSITVFWDVSSSANSRNLEKETALLQGYLSALDGVTVTVVPFNIQTYPPSVFHISVGNSKELVDYLGKNKDFDGGTQLGALNFQAYPADEIMLFTDGISTFGKKEIILSKTPVTTISSSPGADFSYLKHIALETGGRFFDLCASESKAVSEQLLKERRRFIRAEYNPGEIEELVTSTQTGTSQGFAVSGILKGGTATVMLHFGYGQNSSSQQTITIQKAKTETAHVSRMWANMMISQLDLQYEKNKAAITVLGKQFSIVTQNTSLLVLDRVEDYVENDIEPPADLMKEYLVLMKEKNTSRKDEQKAAREEAETAMTELSDWWHTPVQKKPLDAVDTTEVVALDSASNYYVATTTAASSASVQPPPLVGGISGFTNSFSTSANAQEMRLSLTDADGSADDKTAGTYKAPTIEVKTWKADAPYLKELEKAAPADRFKKYLSLKTKYATQPSFYIEVARFFYEKKELPVALQVLSNVAEMKLESPELLRIVADQLMEFGEKDLAIETYKEILNIREEEPQAYRDLALAYNETGNYKDAVQLLHKVATGVWDGRFGDIRQIALSEMNAIISAHPNQVELTGIDAKLIKALPVDIRIVMGWSADNSDIDLWVTDPKKEKCFFQNTNTAIGGRISRDATQGYGPEEYQLKKAADGNYEIEVNLYGDHRETLGGPITIKAELFTNFGRVNQQRKIISVRVTEHKEVVKVGRLGFGREG
jgi:tetratricopeptide (TPR) repeat protein